MSELLTAKERSRFEKLDAVIERSLGAFVEVGRALTEIRDGSLYRERFSSFDAYCKERHELSRRHADRLIESAEVVRQIKTETHGSRSQPILPANERQTRELARVPEDEVEAVWHEVVSEHEETGEAITAKKIREKVDAKLSEGEEPEEPAESPEEPEPEDESPSLDIETLAEPYRRALNDIRRIRKDIKALGKEQRTGGHLKQVEERIYLGLDDAKVPISSATPTLVCHECDGDGCKRCRHTGFLTKHQAEELAKGSEVPF